MKKRNVQDTSKKAYKTTQKKRLSREKTLSKYAQDGNKLTAEIAAAILKIPRNEAAKRLSDLYTKGILIKIGKSISNKTHKEISVYELSKK